MAYDPQARHRRPKPAADDPVPVDSLLGDPPTASGPGGPGAPGTSAGLAGSARSATAVPEAGSAPGSASGSAPGAQGPGGLLEDDPPPEPTVTPAPADPRSDRLLISSGVMGAIGAAVGALLLHWLWKHRRRGPNPDNSPT